MLKWTEAPNHFDLWKEGHGAKSKENFSSCYLQCYNTVKDILGEIQKRHSTTSSIMYVPCWAMLYQLGIQLSLLLSSWLPALQLLWTFCVIINKSLSALVSCLQNTDDDSTTASNTELPSYSMYQRKICKLSFIFLFLKAHLAQLLLLCFFTHISHSCSPEGSSYRHINACFLTSPGTIVACSAINSFMKFWSEIFSHD